MADCASYMPRSPPSALRGASPSPADRPRSKRGRVSIPPPEDARPQRLLHRSLRRSEPRSHVASVRRHATRALRGGRMDTLPAGGRVRPCGARGTAPCLTPPAGEATDAQRARVIERALVQPRTREGGGSRRSWNVQAARRRNRPDQTRPPDTPPPQRGGQSPCERWRRAGRACQSRGGWRAEASGRDTCASVPPPREQMCAPLPAWNRMNVGVNLSLCLSVWSGSMGARLAARASAAVAPRAAGRARSALEGEGSLQCTWERLPASTTARCRTRSLARSRPRASLLYK